MVRHAIGIDLGGTSVKYAVVASSGEVLFNGQLPALAQESAEAVLGQILKGVEACREYAAGGSLTLAGVGIGTPGVVSADGRTVLGGAENIAGWENVPLADRIEQAAGLKTLAGNDANMMALGETLFGAAKGASDAVFVTVGTGIGCGVLIGGRLFRGYRNRGMEMGHITVKCDGEACACGGRGCLEPGRRAGYGGALELPGARHRLDDQPLRPAARGRRGRHLRSRGFLSCEAPRRGPAADDVGLR